MKNFEKSDRVSTNDVTIILLTLPENFDPMPLNMRKVAIFRNPLTKLTTIQNVLEEQGFGVFDLSDRSIGNIKSILDDIKPGLILIEAFYRKDHFFQILRGVRERFPSTPIITLLSKSENSAIEKIIQSGADDFIFHNSSSEELLARINAAAFNMTNYADNRMQEKETTLDNSKNVPSVLVDEEQLIKFYSAIEQSSSMILMADRDGRIAYANNKFHHETGYTKEDLLNDHLKLFDCVYFSETDVGYIWKRLKRGEVWEGELLNKKKNGDVYWEKISVAPVYDENNNIIHYIAIKENINEEKQLNDRILQQNKYDQLRSEFWKFAFLSESEEVLLDNLLKRLGQELNLDRISLLKCNKDTKELSIYEYWIREELHRQRNYFPENLQSQFYDQVRNEGYFEMPDEKIHELKNLFSDYYKDVQSQLVVAVGNSEKPSGFFFLEDFKKKRGWSSQDVKITRDLANIVKLKTETLESSEILRRSEEKFRIITETSRELVCIHDRQGYFKYVSPSSKEMLGYDPDELLGGRPHDLVYPDDLGIVSAQFNENKSVEGLDNKNEYRIRRKDGQYIWFETITQPITNKGGEVIELQTSSRDITARKNAENQIREKEEKYRNIFESMFDIYVEVDMNSGKIQEISPSVKRITGYSREELLGRSIFPFYARPEEGRKLHETLRQKERISDFEVTLLNKKGEAIICSYSVRMIRDRKNNSEKMVGTLRDISERKQAEKQLEDAKMKAESASRAKSEFLANMSHEIRTPMNAILGFSEVLMNKIHDEENKSHLEAILSSGRTLLSLINDILDLSKIEEGKMKMNYEPVELPVLIEDIEHIFEKKLTEKNLDLKIDIDRDLPNILILDEVRIRQILFNLVGNAIKFTNEGYIKIGVYSRKTGDDLYELTIMVKDTGVGIPRKQQRLIFNAFQQQEGQDSRRYEGSGLGLSITKKLVEKMQGRINLESRIGQGSKFEIILPGIKKGEPRESIEHEETHDHTNIHFKPVEILIVDDIQYNIDTLKNLLDSENITFTEAQNAEKALEIIKITPPDIVLMDLKLPDMSGYEATAIIKAQKHSKKIPVLAFTATAMVSDNNEAKTLFDDFVTKPVSQNQIYGKLRKFLPYWQKDVIRTGEQDNDSITEGLTEGDHAKLIEKLEYDLMMEWNEIKDNLVIYRIEDFLEKLDSLNEKFSIKIIQNYYEELKSCVNNFEIERMENKIQEFPEIVEKIKST